MALTAGVSVLHPKMKTQLVADDFVKPPHMPPRINVVILTVMATAVSPTQNGTGKSPPLGEVGRGGRFPRHTPFLPGDYWNGERPDFGPTETDVKVLVNSTAQLRCPISHVADSRVRFDFFWSIFIYCHNCLSFMVTLLLPAQLLHLYQLLARGNSGTGPCRVKSTNRKEIPWQRFYHLRIFYYLNLYISKL